METQSAAPAVVSKGEFAAIANVTPGRVSQWISARKISGDALVGEGRDQKIDVAKAAAQLKRTLDISQRLGNGIDTRLDVGARQAPTGGAQQQAAAPPSANPQTADDRVEEQIKLARLRGIEFDNRKKAQEEAQRRGFLTQTDAAKREMGQIAARMVTLFEGALPEFATAIAAEFKVQQRDVLHILRTKFREVRAGGANAAKQAAAELLEMTETELAPEEEPGAQVEPAEA